MMAKSFNDLDELGVVQASCTVQRISILEATVTCGWRTRATMGL